MVTVLSLLISSVVMVSMTAGVASAAGVDVDDARPGRRLPDLVPGFRGQPGRTL